VAAALADVDALLTPTTLTPPIPIDQVDQGATAAHFTRPVNYRFYCGRDECGGYRHAGCRLSPREIRLDEDTRPGGDESLAFDE
jgi:aspartyl-tRNA(Asn)/glutamyl-tRNA(Gln) amidotransferase subunit A